MRLASAALQVSRPIRFTAFATLMRAVDQALATNWNSSLEPDVDAFEEEIAEYVGVSYAAALSSGTAALHLALHMLGIEPGDEVFCSTQTSIATANPIVYEGGQPVFVDSDPGSWNMDPELLRDALKNAARRRKLPRAVIVVDLYGQCADYDRLVAACEDYDVPLIEDAAEALGASYRGSKAGTFGQCAVFSFSDNKIITAFGGGMLVSNDGELVERAKFLASQACDPAEHNQHSTMGYSYGMSNVLAGIGRVQLRVLPERIAARTRNREYYSMALADLPGIVFMPEASYGEPNHWMTCITIDPVQFGASREAVRLALERENIESLPVWKPLHLQPVFAGCRAVGGQVSEKIFEEGLCLPSGSNLAPDDRARVVDIVRKVHQGCATLPVSAAD